MEPVSSAGLVRGIRRWDLVALVLNAVIGAGIFGLPSQLFRLAGNYSLLAYVVCAALMGLVILCFAEIGSRFSDTGGPYLYARAAFGPMIGFEVGWLLWLTRLTAFAALCNLLVDYLSSFWPAAGTGFWRAAIITAVVLGLGWLNLVGVRKTTSANNLFTVGKLAPLFAFVAIGLCAIRPQNFALAPAPTGGGFSTAVLLLVFAFSGFEAAVIPAGEILDPRRQVPFALVTAMSLTALIYLLIQLVCIGTLPGLAQSGRPLADASHQFLGTGGAVLMTVGALVSVTGTLNSIMLAGPRLLFAMAEQGQLPACLSATHRRFHTPYWAILLSAVPILGFTLAGTFLSTLTFSTITRLSAYAITCAALPALRRKPAVPTAAFTAPAGDLVALAALALCVWLFANCTWTEARAVLVAAAVGLLLCGSVRLGRKRRQSV